MFERFTDRSRKVLELAKQAAIKLNHEYIGTEHILVGLIEENSGVAQSILKTLGCSVHKIYLEIEKITQMGPDVVTMGKLPYTPSAKKALEYAVEEAKKLNHNYVGTEHLLLGLLKENEGTAAKVLISFDLTLAQVRTELLNLLGYDENSGESVLATTINFVNRNAPAGLEQDEQDMKHWVQTNPKLVFFSWKNPYILITVDLENKEVGLKIPYETNIDKIEKQLDFAKKLKRRLE